MSTRGNLPSLRRRGSLIVVLQTQTVDSPPNHAASSRQSRAPTWSPTRNDFSRSASSGVKLATDAAPAGVDSVRSDAGEPAARSPGMLAPAAAPLDPAEGSSDVGNGVGQSVAPPSSELSSDTASSDAACDSLSDSAPSSTRRGDAAGDVSSDRAGEPQA